MSVCGASCEQPSWFGVAGTCNETSLVCLCPPGYSGNDLFRLDNDCHVDDSLTFTMEGIKLGMSVITVLWGSGTLVFLMFHWGLITTTRPENVMNTAGKPEQKNHRREVVPRQAVEAMPLGPNLDMSSTFNDVNSLAATADWEEENARQVGSLRLGGLEDTGADSNVSVAGTADWDGNQSMIVTIGTNNEKASGLWNHTPSDERIQPKRRPLSSMLCLHRPRTVRLRQFQKNFLIVFVLLICYGVSSIVVVALFLAGKERHRGYWMADLMLAIASSSILTGLWIICYAWYKTLPKLGKFSELLELRIVGASGVLIKHPRIVKYVTFFHVGLMSLGSALFLFFIPNISGDVEVRNTCDRLWFLFALVFLISFYSFFNILLVFLLDIFVHLKKRPELLGDVDRSEKYGRLVLTFKVILVANNLLAPFAALTFLLAYVSSNIAFFVALVGIDGHLGAWIVFYMVPMYFAGSKVSLAQ